MRHVRYDIRILKYGRPAIMSDFKIYFNILYTRPGENTLRVIIPKIHIRTRYDVSAANVTIIPGPFEVTINDSCGMCMCYYCNHT
jgi:hypothetical protein